MNHSAKKQLHEKNRKRHKQEALDHAREAAKRGKSKLPMWFLVAGIAVIIVAVVLISVQ